MGGRRKGKDPNHGNSTMVKMRRFMVQTKKVEMLKYKELDPIILANLWTLCQISLTQLSCPIVGCELGRFYRKEAVIELLLDRANMTGKFPPKLHEKCVHIRNMKDVTELKLTPNPNHKTEKEAVIMLNGSSTVAGTEDGSQYHCPITGLEMNGRYKFIFFLTCGCVMSERAYLNVTDGSCPSCSEAYEKLDCIRINPIATEVKTKAKGSMEDRRSRNREEKRDRKLLEKLQVDDNLPTTDKIADWLTQHNDRRRSSNSSTDFEFNRRVSVVSTNSLHSAHSIGEHEDRESRKRRLEEWAKEERRKSIGDLEKQKRLKLIKSQLLAKRKSLLQKLDEESSEDSDSTDSDSD